MSKELKISLPVYKLVYAFCFILILSLIRGVTYSEEIGIALEAPMAILALVYCSDSYVMEIMSKRAGVNRLYPLKNRIRSQYQRMFIQIIFLFILSLIGYGLLWIFQQPVSGIMTEAFDSQKESYFLVMYMVSIIVTIAFWSALSNVISCLFRNMWAGIGCSMLLWLGMNSKAGDQLLGKWNLFSYTFRDTDNWREISWLCGKGVCVCLTILFMMALPTIIKKRG